MVEPCSSINLDDDIATDREKQERKKKAAKQKHTDSSVNVTGELEEYMYVRVCVAVRVCACVGVCTYLSRRRCMSAACCFISPSCCRKDSLVWVPALRASMLLWIVA